MLILWSKKLNLLAIIICPGLNFLPILILQITFQMNHHDFPNSQYSSYYLQSRPFTQLNSLQVPFLISFSNQLNFKISPTEQCSMMLVGEILTKNNSIIQINVLFQKLFISELTLLCERTLRYLHFKSDSLKNKKISQNTRNNCNYYEEFHINIKIDNKSSKIYFQQKPNINESYSFNQINLLNVFIIFIQSITTKVQILLTKYGITNKTLKERCKNNLLVKKEKEIFKKLLKKNEKHQQKQGKVGMDIQINSQKLGVFEEVEVINQSLLEQHQKIQKRGGYFVVSKKKFCLKPLQQENIVHTKILAEKKLSHRKRLGTIYRYEDKIPKQLQLLQSLINLSPDDASHFAKYYLLRSQHFVEQVEQMQEEVPENDYRSTKTFSTRESFSKSNNLNSQNTIYMDYYDENLEEYIQRQGKLDIMQIINVLKQIFKSVDILHKVGIVHRDIKPGNFMLQQTSSGNLKTKLIDYGQSTHVSFQYSQNCQLGFSINYAPIECTFTCKEGYNAKEIDLWSVGVIIFKLIKNRFPLTYSKCFKSDIKTGWPNELNFCLSQNGKGRISIIQNLMIILSTLFMKVRPKDRLNLRVGLRILQRVEQLARQLTSQQLNL